MAGHPPHNPSEGVGPVGTRLESVDEIRQAIQARLPPAGGLGPAPPAPRGPAGGAVPPAAPAAPAPPPEPETPLYRPSRRPTTGLLTVFDDGRDEGEQIRLRGDRFIIGRTEGDLVIPHDGLLS